MRTLGLGSPSRFEPEAFADRREAQTADESASGQGTNSATLRQFNERVILKALRRMGEASKADLARAAGLTNNTAGQIVRHLMAQGLMREHGKRSDGSRGQPARLLGLDPAGAHAIGLQIGRRSLELMLVDFAGAVLGRRRRLQPLALPHDALDFAVQAIGELADEVEAAAALRPVGIGVAMPYDMGSWQRELAISDAAFAAWNSFDLKTRLQRTTGMPVVIENDGTAAAAAELFSGYGRELDDFLYIFIGDATGGGVVTEGDYRRGARGNAGDIGLMPTSPSRLASVPRNDGEFEIVLTRASIASLIRHLDHAGHPVSTPLELEACLAARPAAVDEWLDDCAQALVAPILAAVRVLDVPHVILDGDLPRPLLRDLIGRLDRVLVQASPEARPPPALLAGQMGREAATLGAAILPFHVSFSPSRGLLIGGQAYA